MRGRVCYAGFAALRALRRGSALPLRQRSSPIGITTSPSLPSDGYRFHRLFREAGARRAQVEGVSLLPLTLCPQRCGTGKELGPQNCAPPLPAAWPAEMLARAIEAAAIQACNALSAAI